MKMHKIFIALFSIYVLCLGACSTNTNETGRFLPVDASCWKYGDTLKYKVESADSVWQGDIAIVVRHAASYPFSNLWVELGYPPQDSLKADTLNIVLADDFGNWYGRGLGLSFQLIDTIARNVELTSPAELSVRHIMRSDCINGIEQIGLIFVPTKNEYKK